MTNAVNELTFNLVLQTVAMASTIVDHYNDRPEIEDEYYSLVRPLGAQIMHDHGCDTFVQAISIDVKSLLTYAAIQHLLRLQEWIMKFKNLK